MKISIYRAVGAIFVLVVLQSCATTPLQQWQDYCHMATLKELAGDLHSAENLWRTALNSCHKGKLNNLYLIISLKGLADVLLAEHRNAEALASYEQLLCLPEATQADRLGATFQKGRCEVRLGDFEGAKKDLARAMSLERELYGAKHLQEAVLITKMGDLDFIQGNFSHAEGRYTAARHLLVVLSQRSFLTAAMDNRLGFAAEANNDSLQAYGYFVRAATSPSASPWSQQNLVNFAKKHHFEDRLPKLPPASLERFFLGIRTIPLDKLGVADKKWMQNASRDFERPTADDF